jgi:hypothetical protein
LKFDQFLKSEDTVLDSTHLFKLKVLIETDSLDNVKPYIEDEFRQTKLAQIKLFESFSCTFYDHKEKFLSSLSSEVDNLLFFKLISILVNNTNQTSTLNCLKTMSSVTRSRVAHLSQNADNRT